MKELKFGLNISNEGMEFFGTDELNKLIEEGWLVKSISPSQAFVKENPEAHTEESESFTFAGYEMCAILEHAEFNKLFGKACSLSEGLIRFDKAEGKEITFFDRRKLKQSIYLFEKSLKIDPNNAGALLLKAKCHGSLNQNREALDSLETAFEIEPFNDILCCEIGAVLTKERNFDRAIEVLEQCLQNHPEDPRILSNLGLSYLFAGLPDKAIVVYTKLVEVEPDYDLNLRFLNLSKRIENGQIAPPKNEADIAKII